MKAPAGWKWFGSAGHFICSRDCRFHLTTLIGRHLISTVGELLPDSAVREIYARTRGIVLEGMGDARLADWMKKCGFEDVGYQRKYETMVFRVSGKRCKAPECGCGLPDIIPSELDFAGYNTAGAATAGHMRLCRKWSKK